MLPWRKSGVFVFSLLVAVHRLLAPDTQDLIRRDQESAGRELGAAVGPPLAFAVAFSKTSCDHPRSPAGMRCKHAVAQHEVDPRPRDEPSFARLMATNQFLGEVWVNERG